MAIHGLPDFAFMLIDGIDCAGLTNNLSDEIVNETEDMTCGGALVKVKQYTGVATQTIDQNGFYDSVITDNFKSQGGTNRIVCYTIEGNTVGKACECAAGALQTSYQRTVAHGALTKGNANLQANSSFDHSLILHQLQDETAGVDTAAQDGGALSANGGRFYVQSSLVTLGGYTNWKVELWDSPDGSTGWAIVAGSTAVTVTAIGAAIVNVTGNVRRWTRCHTYLTGAGASPHLTFMSAFYRI